ncbi:MAG TPA: type II secretion system inner membrane protein GspF [Gammaproteobacteria bacterium]|nr:type II secretion system inner membrane protein GspF [Gammaproteobacteria bacterium]
MGAYEYAALDRTGRQRKGVAEGDTPRQVRQQLREQGLIPLDVSPVSETRTGPNAPRRMRFGRRISASDLALITRQLATLVRAALPLEEALLAVSQQTDRARLKSMVLAIRSRVMEGHPLATGLAQFPRVFPEIYLATVQAGEQSGHLEEVLDRLADYTESRQQMHQQALLVLIYPAALFIVAMGVALGLVTYVIPTVAQVFQHHNQTLPLLTRMLIALSAFLRVGWPYLLVAVIAGSIGLYFLLQRPGPRRRYHRMLLRAPLLSRLVAGLNAARFARTLSILAGSGVPVLEALRIAGQVVSNIPMREAVDDATRRVREGSAISKALGNSRLFPPMTIHLIASGETSGRLEEMLDRAARNQEQEMQALIETLMAVVQPGIILLMGAMVATIVIAILLPIFDLNQLIAP